MQSGSGSSRTNASPCLPVDAIRSERINTFDSDYFRPNCTYGTRCLIHIYAWCTSSISIWRPSPRLNGRKSTDGLSLRTTPSPFISHSGRKPISNTFRPMWRIASTSHSRPLYNCIYSTNAQQRPTYPSAATYKEPGARSTATADSGRHNLTL